MTRQVELSFVRMTVWQAFIAFLELRCYVDQAPLRRFDGKVQERACWHEYTSRALGTDQMCVEINPAGLNIQCTLDVFIDRNRNRPNTYKVA